MAGRICFAGICMTKGVPNLERGFVRPKLGTPFSFFCCFLFCGRVLRTAPLDKLSLSIRELHIGVVREFICPPLFLRLFSNTPLEKLHSVVLDAVFLLLFLLFSKQLSHHCQHIEISKTEATPGLEIAWCLCYNECVA